MHAGLQGEAVPDAVRIRARLTGGVIQERIIATPAAIEQLGILDDLVGEVVLGCELQSPRFDAQVQVLGHENHLGSAMFGFEVLEHRKALVVVLLRGGACHLRKQAILEEQTTGCLFAVEVL
jgi:hypothetical protein